MASNYGFVTFENTGVQMAGASIPGGTYIKNIPSQFATLTATNVSVYDIIEARLSANDSSYKDDYDSNAFGELQQMISIDELTKGIQVPGSYKITRADKRDGKIMHAGLLDFSGYMAENIAVNDEWGVENDYTNPFVYTYSTIEDTGDFIHKIYNTFNTIEYVFGYFANATKNDMRVFNSTLDIANSTINILNEQVSSIQSNLQSIPAVHSSMLGDFHIAMSDTASDIDALQSDVSDIQESLGSAVNALEDAQSQLGLDIDEKIARRFNELLGKMTDDVADSVFDYVLVYDDADENNDSHTLLSNNNPDWANGDGVTPMPLSTPPATIPLSTPPENAETD